jgi:uncharacterized membrane protein YgcG
MRDEHLNECMKAVETPMKRYRPKLALLIVAPLVLSSVELGCATQLQEFEPSRVAPASAPASPQPPEGTQMSPGDLDQLVAPIALYPDPLVAQVLAASTNPTEIVEADRWLEQNSALKGQSLAQAVDQRPWDPSVKALTQFPVVLAMMDQNLSWTSALGAAYTNESQSVLAAVQAMRRRAQQAGNLKGTPQESVTDDGQTIAIEPANPQIVYVPEYDPWLIYGAPLAIYPAWIGLPGVFVEAPGVYFGLGIGIGYFAGLGWGWHHWGADWDHHRVWHDHQTYVSHSPTFRGFDHGHDAFGHDGFGHGDADHRGPSGHSAIGGNLGHTELGAGRLAEPGVAAHGMSGIHTGAFGGFNHGGVVGGYSARGQTSLGGGFHGGGGHAGGFAGGGFHGGGGHR